VFDSVRQLQRLASTLCYNQVLTPTTTWNQEQTIIQYKKYQVKIANLTTGIEGMFKNLLRGMHALSAGNPVPYTIPEDLVDDLSAMGRGLSWIDRCHTEPRTQGLMHAMVREGRWNLSTVNKKGTLSWNRVACEGFMQEAADIVDRIIVLVHMGAGPPLRGEDLVRDQITNAIQPRTIYLSFGKIMAIRRHSKVTNLKGIDPFNVCFFPKGLSEAICYYLLVVRPLERVVARQLYKDSQRRLNYDVYLYVKHGERMSSTQLSDTLSKLTKEFVGVSLGIQPLRHIMIGFQRAYVEESRVLWGDNIGDLLSSHKSKVADQNYSLEHGLVEGAISSRLLDIQEWCDGYHDAIGLGSRIGPLISLRAKRKLARGLSSLASVNPGDREGANSIASILKELGSTAYRSALEDLKPLLTQEVWEAVASGIERLASDGVFHRGSTSTDLPSRPHEHVQPTNAPSHLLLPPTTAPPSIGSGSQQQTKRPRLSADKHGRAQKKKKARAGSSTGRQEDLSSETRTPEPFEHGPGSPEPFEHDPDALQSLEPASDTPQSLEHTPDHLSLQSIPIRPKVALRPKNQSQAAPTVASTARQMSVMSLGPDPPPPLQQHAVSTAGNTAAPDTLREELRKYRRDPTAEFKSPHQRQLLESVMKGNYTLAILPTGGGKSLSFELPPSFQGQITIAALPYKVILSQALQNAKARGMEAEIWYSSTPKNTENVRLILMPFETFFLKTTLE
jgi:hypothetical protein